jgi:molybdopterin synthase sulfur carrier subunit
MSDVEVRIPRPLRSLVGGAAQVEVRGSTVGEVLQRLTADYPALRPHLYTEEGQLRNFVGVYRNDVDVRGLEREATVLSDGDELSIVRSISGG